MDNLKKEYIEDYDEYIYNPIVSEIEVPSRQIVEIEVTLFDIIKFWSNKPKKLPFSRKDYTPYIYEDPYENIEYYCKYNYLYVSLNVIKSLLDGNKKVLKVAVYGYKKGMILPPFFKFLKEYDVPKFKHPMEEIKYRSIKNKCFYIKKVDFLHLLIMKTNICFDYYKHAKLLPCNLCYDIQLEDFWASGTPYTKAEDEAGQKLYSIFESLKTGVNVLLNLQVNNKGEIVKPLSCNKRLLFFLYYKVPSIPVNLCYLTTTNLFDTIETYYHKEDLDYANKYFEGNLIFKGNNI